MERPKVSVIIPIYKVENYLVECLESVVNQTLRELEIILLDEGDMDRCREIIDFYEQADPRIVAIHEPNPDASYGAKINRGLDRATGEFISFIEPDDFIELDMYAEMYACAERTGANIVKAHYFDYYNKNKDTPAKTLTYLNRNVPREKPFSIFQFPHLLCVHPLYCSCLYRREALNRNGIRSIEAPRAGYVDNCFFLDAYIKMGSIVWLDKPVYHWRRNGEGSSSTNVNWDRRAMLERWNRNLDLYPPDSQEYGVFAPYFAEKAWASIFRHYLEGWVYNEEEYEALTVFLNRFTEYQILSAPRVKEENRALMLQCRNDPEGFKECFVQNMPETKKSADLNTKEKTAVKEQTVSADAPVNELAKTDAGKPEDEKDGAPQKQLPSVKETAGKKDSKKKSTPIERLCKKISSKAGLAALFCTAVFFLLAGIALQAGVYQSLFSNAVNLSLTKLCGVLSVVCIFLLCVCVAAKLYLKVAKAQKKR